MNVPLWLKAVCTLVIVAGLGLKVIASRHAAAEPLPPVKPEVVDFLTAQGLRIVRTDDSLDLIVIEAERAPACHMAVAVMAPQGWHGGVVRSMVEPGDRLFFVFNGETLADQPVMRSRAWLYWSLIRQHMGLPADLHPLLGVITRGECGAQALPWARIARLSGAMPRK